MPTNQAPSRQNHNAKLRRPLWLAVLVLVVVPVAIAFIKHNGQKPIESDPSRPPINFAPNQSATQNAVQNQPTSQNVTQNQYNTINYYHGIPQEPLTHPPGPAPADAPLAEKRANELFRQGCERYLTNDFDGAQKKYEAAIATYDKLKHVRTNLGATLWRLGKKDRAKALFEEAVDQDAEDIHAKANLAVLLAEENKFERAAELLRSAIKLSPSDPDLRAILCSVARSGKFSEALDEGKKATELNPNNARAYRSLGEAYYRRGVALHEKLDYDASLREYRKSIELDPKNSVAQRNLGQVLADLGRFSEAILEFKKSLEIDSTDSLTYFGLGSAYERNKSHQEAIRNYQKAKELNPENADVHFNLGRLLLDSSRYDAALGELQTTINIQPKHARAHDSIGVIYSKRGELKAAADMHRQATKYDPKCYTAWYNLACALARIHPTTDETFQALSIALELHPEYRERANRDDDFQTIRKDSRFVVLMNQNTGSQKN